MNSIHRLQKAILVISLLVLIPFAGYTQGRLKFSTIKGVVVDKYTQMPVPFSKIFLYRIDAEGYYIPLDTMQTQKNAAFLFFVEASDSVRNFLVVANAPEYPINDVIVEFSPDEIGTEKNVVVSVRLQRCPEIGRLIYLEDVYFDQNEKVPYGDYMEILDSLVFLLVHQPQIRIEIGGHCDGKENKRNGKKLSEERAISVMDYLVNNGIEKERLEYYGYGADILRINPELNDEDKQLNRRVEFKILSIDYPSFPKDRK